MRDCRVPRVGLHVRVLDWVRAVGRPGAEGLFTRAWWICGTGCVRRCCGSGGMRLGLRKRIGFDWLVGSGLLCLSYE